MLYPTYPQASADLREVRHSGGMGYGGVREGQVGGLRGLARGRVLQLRDAVDAGWARATVYRRTRVEGWTPLGVGAWAEPGAEVDLAMRVRAVQGGPGPRLIASHSTAAALWGIELFANPGDPRDSGEYAELEFTDPQGARTGRRQRSGIALHGGALEAGEVCHVSGGLEVTTVPRTLTDLLRTADLDQAVVAVDSALTWRRRGDGGGGRRPPLVRLDELAAVTAALPRPGRRKAEARLALADPRSESVAETVARLRMYEAGLRPEAQAELVTREGRGLRVDFLFRVRGVVVEIEGYAYHGTRSAHAADLRRFNALQSCPEVRSVLRFSAVEVFTMPDVMIARIRAALAGGSGAVNGA